MKDDIPKLQADLETATQAAKEAEAMQDAAAVHAVEKDTAANRTALDAASAAVLSRNAIVAALTRKLEAAVAADKAERERIEAEQRAQLQKEYNAEAEPIRRFGDWLEANTVSNIVGHMNALLDELDGAVAHAHDLRANQDRAGVIAEQLQIAPEHRAVAPDTGRVWMALMDRLRAQYTRLPRTDIRYRMVAALLPPLEQGWLPQLVEQLDERQETREAPEAA
jgi:hypothetical protein